MRFIKVLIVIILFSSCVRSQGILGVNVSDGLPANPSLLTWAKVHEERFLNLMDENHVHYTSDFASSVSNLSEVSGSSPSISGGNLVVSGSVKYKSTSTSVAAWTTTEMTIASMGMAGDSNKLGPQFIVDATHLIAGVYDNVNTRLQIIQNDTVLMSNTISALNTTNLKLFLVIAGNSFSIWYQEDGEDLTCGFSFNSRIDMKADGVAADYKYGVYCLQSGATTTHNVSSLRGAACGFVSLFNDKIVRNTDGSEYLLDGKLLMTADGTNISSQAYPWNDANSVLLSIDTATFAVEIIGRFYFDRASRRLGGQALHVIWEGSQWLITYTTADNNGLAETQDQYFRLDYADIFTEIIVEEADLTPIGVGAGAYDVSTRIIEGEYKILIDYGFSGGLSSGVDMDNQTAIASFSNEYSWECNSWIRYRDTWYLTYSAFGDTRQVVLTYPDMDFVGYMDLPFVTSSYIPGYDWYCKQVNGKTIYHMIGFDTHLYTATIPNFGVTPFAWTLGNLVVWKATETKNGNEF